MLRDGALAHAAATPCYSDMPLTRVYATISPLIIAADTLRLLLRCHTFDI